MAALRLLGLTFLLLATLGYAGADSGDHTYKYEGRSYITEDYYYFYNYYKEGIKWYFYSHDRDFRGRYNDKYLLFDFYQPTYYRKGRPGTYLYHYDDFPGNFDGFDSGIKYYGYYEYRGYKYYFSFKYSESRYDRDSRPYTFTAYPKRGRKYGFYDDSKFSVSQPSDFGS